MKKHTIMFLLGSLILVSVLFAANCSKSGKTLGAQIPDNEKTVRLSQIVSAADQYNGKTVRMEGIVSGQCASLCEFFFKDGAHTATIFPQGFKLPKLETGRKVAVYARVTAGEEQVVFSALGLRFE